MKRALVPARLRRVVLGWFDSRYISRADHRQDIKDALWEVQTLGREIVSLRAEVGELRAQVDKVRLDPIRAKRWDDAHRLSEETAVAMDGVLQNEVLLWQAVDRLSAGPAGPAGPAGSADTVTSEGSADTVTSEGSAVSVGSATAVTTAGLSGSSGSAA
ncbi:hypothetical protein [Streptosporangium subroseum]|uniref:hypothetical protein n=1 Tax=Streptosporangium subroseum TaxID=106412 RepID=UPI0015C5EDA0|nr:hypothetical protein [Streptosporangium subroseum]